MKTILGIIASPRRLGNSELVIKEISRNVPEKHTLNLLRLSDFHIKPCKGCYICLFKKERCILKDDLYTIIEAMEKADAWMVAAPAYFLGANSVLKRLLDRGLSFYARIEKLWGKPAVGIGIAGIEGKEGVTLLNVESFLRLTLADVKACTMMYGALPGEIFMNPENREMAARLAKALFGDSIRKETPACPLCGGDTFRFMGGNRIRCMLCSNSGIVEMESNQPLFKIEKDKHGLFLTRKEALEHRDWLRKERERFLQQRENLKEIVLLYENEGVWIKPDK